MRDVIAKLSKPSGRSDRYRLHRIANTHIQYVLSQHPVINRMPSVLENKHIDSLKHRYPFSLLYRINMADSFFHNLGWYSSYGGACLRAAYFYAGRRQISWGRAVWYISFPNIKRIVALLVGKYAADCFEGVLSEIANNSVFRSEMRIYSWLWPMIKVKFPSFDFSYL